MKSFIATLTQAERPAPVIPARKSVRHVEDDEAPKRKVDLEKMKKVWGTAHAVRDAAVADKYLSVIGDATVSTPEIAAATDSRATDVFKQLNRLVSRGLLQRAGTAPYNGGRPAILWKATGGIDKKYPENKAWERVLDTTFFKAIGAGRQRDTAYIAKAVKLDYYAALVRLKKLEAAGAIKRVGVNRRVKAAPHIIWELV